MVVGGEGEGGGVRGQLGFALQRIGSAITKMIVVTMLMR